MSQFSAGVFVGTSWSLVFRLLAALSGLLVTMLVTRQLSQEDVGRYFSLFSFVSIAAVVIGAGMSTAVVRLIAQAQAEGHAPRSRRVIGMALTSLLLGALCAGALLAMPGSRQILTQVLNLQPGVSFFLVWAWVALLALQTLLAEMFRGFHDIFLASLFGGACSALLSVLALGVLHGLGIASLNAVMAMLVLALTGSVVLASLRLRSACTSLGSGAMGSWRALFHTSLPLWLTQLMLVALLQADIWILQSTGDAAAVAHYGAATRMTLLLTLPLAVLNAAIIPAIAAHHALGEHARLQALLRHSAALAALPALIAMLVFVVAGPALLGLLFGDTYRAAAPLLLVLALGQLINVLCGSAGYTLMMTGRHGDSMWITLGAGVLTIVAGLLAVRSHGALGLAWASAAGLATQSVAMWLRVRQVHGLRTHPSWSGLLQPLATLRQLR